MSEVLKNPMIIIILLVVVAIIFLFLSRMFFGWSCGIGCSACEVVSNTIARFVFGQTVGGLITPFHPVCRTIPI